MVCLRAWTWSTTGASTSLQHPASRGGLTCVKVAWDIFISCIHACILDSEVCPARTHLASILRGRADGRFVVWKGVKCSTWVSISRPSCGRSWLDPLGYDLPCVHAGNTMVSRTAIVIYGMCCTACEECAGRDACDCVGGFLCCGAAFIQFAGYASPVSTALQPHSGVTGLLISCM